MSSANGESPRPPADCLSSDDPPADDEGGPELEVESTSLEARMTAFVSTIIERLFRVGLTLARVESRLGPSHESEELASAIDELDEMIREVRELAFGLVLGNPKVPPPGRKRTNSPGKGPGPSTRVGSRADHKE